jgi:hypothetical protein
MSPIAEVPELSLPVAAIKRRTAVQSVTFTASARVDEATYADATITLSEGGMPEVELFTTGPLAVEVVKEPGETSVRMTCSDEVLTVIAAALSDAVARAQSRSVAAGAAPTS